MTIQEIKQLLANKVADLTRRKSEEFALGNMERLSAVESELLDTQSTLDKLNTL